MYFSGSSSSEIGSNTNCCTHFQFPSSKLHFISRWRFSSYFSGVECGSAVGKIIYRLVQKKNILYGENDGFHSN
jgi:hypothetical protein